MLSPLGRCKQGHCGLQVTGTCYQVAPRLCKGAAAALGTVGRDLRSLTPGGMGGTALKARSHTPMAWARGAVGGVLEHFPTLRPY